MMIRSLSAFFLLACVTAAGLVHGSHAQTPSDNREIVDRVVAVVESDVILKSDVDQMVASMQQQRQQRGEASSEMWSEGLNQLINQRVMAEIARRDTNITIPDEQVDAQLERQIQQMAAQAGGEDALAEMYGQTPAEMRESFRDEFRDQMLADQVRRQRVNRVRITPSEIEEWFNQIPEEELPILPASVRISHIVRYPEPTEEARAEAEEIITAIRDSVVAGGASFEEMAEQFSEDPGSAQRGGRIDNISLDGFVPEFAAVAARIPEGEVSEPFYNPTHTGYHILRVNERRGNTVDLNHILIRVDRRSADESQTIEFLNTVRDSILHHGQPFERMASRHSQETRSADMGGRVVDPRTGTRDLAIEQLGPSWQRSLRGLEEGEISEPNRVRLLDGDRAFHIVKLHRRVPEHRVNLEMDYERIRQFALQEKQARVLEEWLQEKREEFYINILVDDPEALMASQ
ncbi:MAG: peptidylprolyl isomerase [Longimonas sp.]|uniref:peptidylprolyl isomerase n=1 Tax=Longimonas sp. TaxID=2039626 RepID=UPI0033531A57